MKSSPIQNLIVKNNKTISTENVAGGEKKEGCFFIGDFTLTNWLLHSRFYDDFAVTN